ncbi:MAG: endolytic transglycosylase MltG [Ancrocorticia sp.]|jgi:UPF0755 protein|nr:endolytic transglycosylase MltG [Ancrocorticia sp.]MCI2002893.1 endolytic transglycosylase MltG [Ancrocorticia sp.]MCI2013283.1 endolytic transglycosylase MltG [Ancrocorticia sp.]
MSDFFDEMGASENTGVRRTRVRRSAEAVKVRKKQRVRTAIISSILVMILTAIGVVVVPEFFDGEKTVSDYEGLGHGSVTVVIPDGATGTDMGQILAKSGVVATSKAFVDAYKADSRASGIQPGTYSLRLEMSAAGAVTALLDPSNKAEIKVTIPEGFTTWQVYARLENALGVSLTDVEEAAKGDIGLPDGAGGSPEGWYAPLTYTFEPDTTPAEALSEMVAKRVEQLKQLGIAQDEWEKTLTIASIVEREGNSTDYAKVARVILNRLDESSESVGLLQMDSTVLYGLGIAGGVPTQDQLDQDTPYNTYLHKGLPPTPIGSPGEEAIEAAVSPADGDWLYFVTVNLDTGETLFATTLDEQNKNVEKFKQWCSDNPGSCD